MTALNRRSTRRLLWVAVLVVTAVLLVIVGGDEYVALALAFLVVGAGVWSLIAAAEWLDRHEARSQEEWEAEKAWREKAWREQRPWRA